MSDSESEPISSRSERDIFLEALERESPEDRAAWLEEACAGDVALRDRIAVLLESHGGVSAGFLDQPAAEVTPGGGLTATIRIAERPGTEIGNYRLLEEIGVGGFGVVYLAQQSAPVRRKVALKIIKPGMDTREVIARFEAERQTLALMDHPNIAQVYDAGATDSGRPYFVMELVGGDRITQYCDRHHLKTRARLELFLRVCAAVQHAHQKGIIHRDLKPSNILVTERDDEPLPKVIDFGIAKAIMRDMSGATLYTSLGQAIGTPQYMSPEQAGSSGLDIDTRADIYSLGVILYELITGTTPIEPGKLRTADIREIQRLVVDEEPAMPSTRVSAMGAEFNEVAKQRGEEPGRLRRQIRGDLDWIIMKALDKDRGRRYETANAMAVDIQRHLDQQVVLAGPPSSVYRLKKFARRNRGFLAAAAAVVAALLVGTGVSIWQAVQAGIAKDAAIKAEEEARTEAANRAAVVEFLEQDLFGQADTAQGANRDLTLRAAVDNAAREVRRRFEGEPRIEASIRFTLSKIYESLGDYGEALVHGERSAELSQTLNGLEKEETRRAVLRVSNLHVRRHNLDKAQQILEPLANYYPEDSPEFADVLASKGLILAEQKRYEEAAEALGKAAALRTRHRGAADTETLRVRSNHATVLSLLGRHDDAIAAQESLIEIVDKKFSRASLESLRARARLADFQRRAGENERALEMLTAVLDDEKRLLDPGHPEILQTQSNLAELMDDLGWKDEAETLWREILAGGDQSQPPDAPRLLVMHHLAISIAERGEHEKALELLERTRRGKIRLLGKDAAPTLLTEFHIAQSLNDLRRVEQAIELLRDVYPRHVKTAGIGHRDSLRIAHELGESLLRVGREQDAVSFLREAMVEGEPDGPAAREQFHRLAELRDSIGGVSDRDDDSIALADAARRFAANPDGVVAWKSLGNALRRSAEMQMAAGETAGAERDRRLAAFAVAVPFLSNLLGEPRLTPDELRDLVGLDRSGGRKVEMVLGEGAVWRYWDRAGSELPADWFGVEFDDAAWPQGAAALGYGDSGTEATEIGFGGDPSGKYMCACFRARIQIADPAAGPWRIFLVADDGGVVHLNGKEAGRLRMPDGDIGFSTPATAAMREPEESEAVAIPFDSGLLHAGENVVAVEVHQVQPESSDLSFALYLTRGLLELADIAESISEADIEAGLAGSDRAGALMKIFRNAALGRRAGAVAALAKLREADPESESLGRLSRIFGPE